MLGQDRGYLPNLNSPISFFKPFHSPLAKSSTKMRQLATSDWETIMSMTTVNVSFLITFLNASCVRKRVDPYDTEAAMVHKKPIAYFPLERSLQLPMQSQSQSHLETQGGQRWYWAGRGQWKCKKWTSASWGWRRKANMWTQEGKMVLENTGSNQMLLGGQERHKLGRPMKDQFC